MATFGLVEFAQKLVTLSSLWSLGDFFEKKFDFSDDEYVEFSKLTQDKVGQKIKLVNNVHKYIDGQNFIDTRAEPSTQQFYSHQLLEYFIGVIIS